MDIDIDFKTTFDVVGVIPYAVKASMVRAEQLTHHNCGAYLQNVPVDHVTGFAAIPYKEAPKFGFMKIDFLHLSLLDQFDSRERLVELANKEPDWNLLMNENIVSKLFQLGKHYDIVKEVRPRSIEELADCVALIRPGKREYLSLYKRNKEDARQLIYRHDNDNKSAFRKSHAIAYAMNIVVQLHMIAAKYNTDDADFE